MHNQAFLLLLQRCKDFVVDVLIPDEERAEAERCISPEVHRGMQELGLFGISLPQEYGGMGLSMVQEVQLMMEIGRAASSYRAHFALNNGGGSLALLQNGSPQQKAQYLHRLAKGEIIGAFALSEPEAGSNAASIVTRYIRSGDGYVLQGTKKYVTHAGVADIYVVFAKDAQENGKISSFIVPSGAPGLEVGRRSATLGLRATSVREIALNNVSVPKEALIGKEGEGLLSAYSSIEKARIHVAAVCCGIATRALSLMTEHAHSRVQFGGPIVKQQFVRGFLADTFAELSAATAMTVSAARLRDQGRCTSHVASATKLFASEMAFRATDNAVQVLGGLGYCSEGKAELLFRDARLFRILDGTSEIQRNVIAKGIDARDPLAAWEGAITLNVTTPSHLV